MTDLKKADENAKKEPSTGSAASVKAQTEGSALGEAARKPTASERKVAEKADAEDRKASVVSAENRPVIDGDDDNDEFDSISFRVRGILMAILIKLPAVARYVSDSEQLDRMFAFVNQFETGDERMVVVELIKAIGETDINKIASAGYEQAVYDAMKVIKGDAISTFEQHSYDSQVDAAARLQLATSGFVQPAIPEAAKKNLVDTTKPRKMEPDESGSDEQRLAKERLYGLTGA